MDALIGYLTLTAVLAVEYALCFLPIHLELRRRLASSRPAGLAGRNVLRDGFVASCAIPAGCLLLAYIAFNPANAPGGSAFGGNVMAMLMRLVLLICIIQVAMIVGSVRMIRRAQKECPPDFGADQLALRAKVAPIVLFLGTVLILILLHALVGLR